MFENRDSAEELRELLAALREDSINDAQAERLAELLRDDAEARRTYIRYMAITAYLHGNRRDSRDTNAGEAGASDDWRGLSGELGRETGCPPIVVESPVGTPLVLASLGGFAFSYAAAVVIVGIGLLVGWACQVSAPQSDWQAVVDKGTRPTAAANHDEGGKVVVGRITGMAECRWSDPHEAPVGFDRVYVDRRFDLLSGLLELSYDTGAKVILQGPCTYKVESKTGGYLSIGRLTARVEKTDAEERSSEKRESANSQTRTAEAALFAIQTPTATVTDLGTEFGVEVAKSGACETSVFRGRVEVRAAGGGTDAKPVLLGKNESVRVDAGRSTTVSYTMIHAGQWVHEMPRRVRIKLYNTGVNLKAGEPDPHWQAIARSDEPSFKPRAAVVSGGNNSMWLSNQPDRSQWISVIGGDSIMPSNAVYTFRTTFELTGVRPESAILHGQFAADNHVRAIRLNGRKVSVPRHGYEEFGYCHPFSIDRGFVEGVNELEIEVENSLAASKVDMPPNPLGLLVELDGSVLSGWPNGSASEVESKKSE
jgi:hypothetical protein